MSWKDELVPLDSGPAEKKDWRDELVPLESYSAGNVSPANDTPPAESEPPGAALATSPEPVAPNQQAPALSPELGFRDRVSGVGSGFLGSLASTGAGILESVNRGNPITAIKSLTLPPKEAADPAVEAMRAFAGDMNANAQAMRPDGGAGGWVYDLASSTAIMAPSVVGTMITKNPTLGLSTMGGQVYGDTYNQAIVEGKSPTDATFEAVRATAYELGPEKVFGFFDRLPIPGGMKKWVMQVASEAAAEATTSAMGQADEVLIQGDEFKGWEEALKRTAYDASLGAGMGGVLGIGALRRDADSESDNAPAEGAPPNNEPPLDETDAEIERRLQAQREAEAAAASVIPQMETPAQPVEQAAPVEQAPVDLLPEMTPEVIAEAVLPQMETPAQPTEQQPAGQQAPVDLDLGQVAAEAVPEQQQEAVPEPEPVEPFKPANEAEQAIVDDAFDQVQKMTQEQIDGFQDEGVQTRDPEGNPLPKAVVAQNFVNTFAGEIRKEAAERPAPEPKPIKKAPTIDKEIADSKISLDKEAFAKEFGFDGQDLAEVNKRHPFKSVFSNKGKGGLTPDEFLRWGEDNGFFPNETDTDVPRTNDLNTVYELLERMVAGEDVYSAKYAGQAVDAEARERFEAESEREAQIQEAEREFGNLDGWTPEFASEAAEVYAQAYEEYVNEENAQQPEAADTGTSQEGRDGGETRADGRVDENETGASEETQDEAERDALGETEVPDLTPSPADPEALAVLEEYERKFEEARREAEPINKRNHDKLAEEFGENGVYTPRTQAGGEFVFGSRAEAEAYAAAYGVDQLVPDNAGKAKGQPLWKIEESNGNFTIRYKTRGANKRWNKIKQSQGFISLHERDLKWNEWEKTPGRVRKNGGSNSQNGSKVVISLFDRTGHWSDPYIRAGYTVVQLDISHPIWAMDIMDIDAEELVGYGWDDVHAVIAAPPCQHFAASGRKYWAAKDKDGRTYDGLKLLEQTQDIIGWLKPDWFAIENPSMGRIDRPQDFDPDVELSWGLESVEAMERMGKRMEFNPHEYGDAYTKKTALYGNFNVPLPTANVFPSGGSKMLRQTGFSKAEQQLRSITPFGFAQAFFEANNPEQAGYVNSDVWMRWDGFDQVLESFGDWQSSVYWSVQMQKRGIDPEFLVENNIKVDFDEFTPEYDSTEQRLDEEAAWLKEQIEEQTGAPVPESSLVTDPTAEEINQAEEQRRDQERDGLGRDEVPMDKGEGELFAGNTPGQRPAQGDVFDGTDTASSATATPRKPATAEQKSAMREIIARLFPQYADIIEFRPRFEGGKGYKFAEYDRRTKKIIVYEDYAGLMNEGALAWLINHELFHGGLDTAFGMQRLRVLEAAAKNPTVRDLAERIAIKRGQQFNELEHVEEALVELGAANETGRLERLGKLYSGFVAPRSLVGETKTLIGRWLDVMRRLMDSLINRRTAMTDAEILEVIGIARANFGGIAGAAGNGAVGRAASSTSSLQNEDRDASRERRGERPLSSPGTQSWEDVLEEAKARLAKSDVIVDRLLERIGTEPDFQLSDFESAILLVRIQQIEISLQDNDADVTTGSIDAQRRSQLLQAELNRIEMAVRQVGTNTARALAFRKAFINSNYTIESMERNARAELGRELTPQERTVIKQRAKNIERAQKKVDAAEKVSERPSKSRIQEVIDRVKKDIPKSKAAPKRVRGKARVAKGRARVLKAMGMDAGQVSMAGPSLPTKNAFSDPEAYLGMVEMAIGIVEEGFTSAADFAKQLAKELGQRIFGQLSSEEIEHLRRQAQEDAQRDPESSADVLESAIAFLESGEPLDSRTVYRLAKAFIEEGMSGENEVMAAVHEALSAFVPGLTERDVRRAFTDYGKAKYPSKDEVATELREMRVMVRLQESIDRLKENLPPLRTGMQRDEQSAAIRERQKLLNEMRKEFDRRNPEQASRDSLKSVNQARVRRLENRIEELTRQINTGEKPVKGEPLPDSEQVVDLKKQVEILKAEIKRLDELANPPKTEEQKQFERLEETKNRLDLVLQNREAAKEQGGFEPLSERNADLKAEVDQLRKQVAEMRREMKKGSKADREARREQKLIDQLEKAIQAYDERIRSGDFSPLFNTDQKPVSEKVAALRKLRDQRAKVYQAMKRAQKPVLTREERINRIRQANLQRQIDDYQRRMKEQDFTSPRSPKEVRDNKKTSDLRWEMEQEKERYLNDLIKWKTKQFGIGKKMAVWVGERLNLTRAIITAFDLSAVLRQGGIIVLGHPVRSFKAFKPMFQALASKQKNYEIHQSIYKRPNARFYKQSGLFIAEWGSTDLNKQEQKYMSRLADKTPGVAASGRAYTTFLNVLRADAFDAMVATLTVNGVATPQEMKVIANFVNVATGRGVVGVPNKFKLTESNDGSSPLLSTIFFAPNYVASRFNFLALQPLYGAGNASKQVRNMVIKEYVRYFAGVSTALSLMAMWAMAMRDEDDEEPILGLDPRSSDFLKVRFGDTRIDMMSGLIQPTVFMARMQTGVSVNSKGQESALRNNPMGGRDLTARFGASTADSVIGRFLRSKLAPIPGSVMNLYVGQDVVGNPTDLPTEAMGLVVPLTFSDVGEMYDEQGPMMTAALTGMVIFGMGASTYGDGGWSHKQGQIQEVFDGYRDDIEAAETPEARDEVAARYLKDYPWLMSEDNIKRYANVAQNQGRWDNKKNEFVPYRVGDIQVNEDTKRPTLSNLPDWARSSPRAGTPRQVVNSSLRALEAIPTYGDIAEAAEWSPSLAEILKEKNPDDKPGWLERREIRGELEDAIKSIKLEELEQIRAAEAGG